MNNRTIKFKARRKDTREWVFGSLEIAYSGECFISWWESVMVESENNYREMLQKDAEVHPETVCQATGLLDKHGKEIWEGDVIRVDEVDTSFPTAGNPRLIQTFEKAVVTWDNRMLTYVYNPIRPSGEYENYAHQMLGYGKNIAVTGNIHDDKPHGNGE